MKRHRKTPSKEDLFAAYRAGVDLNLYVEAKAVFKNHLVALAVSGWALRDFVLVTELFEAGVSESELINAYEQGVAYESYSKMRQATLDAPSGRLVPHDEALLLIRLGVGDVYFFLLTEYYGVTYDAVVEFSQEMTDKMNRDFCNYIIARFYGASVEEANALTEEYTSFPSDTLAKLFVAGIPAADIIEASTLDGGRMILNHRFSYVTLRLEGRVSHKEAMEVATELDLVIPYMEARERRNHQQALALVRSERDKVQRGRKTKRQKVRS